MGCWADFVGRARLVLSTLVVGFVLGSSLPAVGAPAPGFPLLSSQPSPVTGAVTISAPAVLPEAGLVGVQFKVDGYVLNPLDTTAPFQVVWSAASASDGTHTLTAEARLTSGVVIESAPLHLTVANPAASSRVFHVDAAGGSDSVNGLSQGTAWRTWSKARRGETAGDTVVLRGTFTGDLVPPASGTAAKPIIFTSYPGEMAVLDGGSVKLDGRQYVVVERLAVVNAQSAPVVLNGSNFNTIRDCQISNVGNGSGQWGHAIKMTNANDNVVDGCTITNIGNEAENTGDSIYLVDSSRNKILNSTIRNGGHSLIQVSSQQATTFSSDNVIAGNTLSNFYATGFLLSGMSQRTLVEYNRISDSARNGVNWPRSNLIASSYNTIRYNEIFDNAAGAIHIAAYVYQGSFGMDAIGNQIYQNVFYNNNQINDSVNNSGAIHLRESDGRSVRDNLIANNIFFRNKGFISGGNDYAITITHYGNPTSWPVGSLNGNRIQNNIILRQPGSAGEVTVLRIRDGSQGGNLSYTLAAFQQTYANASGNLQVDPMFTDEANRVFTLRSGSPAIDRGLPIAGVAYLGTAPDLGAHEYEGSAPPADTTPPTVALTAPTLGQTVAGVVTLRASASDNVGVTRIDYMQDGQVLGALSPAAMTFSWNTAAVSNGAHTLTARAYDAAGNATTATGISVTVANADTTAPAVAITTPTASPTYPASSSALALGGTASDAVGVTQVTWANTRGGSGTATGTTSWTASGIVLQTGANVLTVTARDAAGNIATRTVTVTYAAATAPTVTITTPTASPTYGTSLSSLSLGGTASGATQVMWANNRGGSGAATGTTNLTASGIGLQAGANVLTVTARDAAGHTATATVTVTYAAATAPTEALTTPTASPAYSTNISSLTLRGTASGATQVMWANSSGGFGAATGTTSWTASGIVLQAGTNVLFVIVRDAAGHTATATVTITYAP